MEVAQLVSVPSCYARVTGSIPGQGAYSRWTIKELMFLSCTDVSVPLSLSLSSEKLSLAENKGGRKLGSVDGPTLVLSPLGCSN